MRAAHACLGRGHSLHCQRNCNANHNCMNKLQCYRMASDCTLFFCVFFVLKMTFPPGTPPPPPSFPIWTRPLQDRADRSATPLHIHASH
ncbi:hypothetical protein GDO81_009476 [Engystomops pustulosus]|uniref:Uncharacterized protein n=1 Tax=Engystomops pustulosus TaxID=76066 RepID=A0AAV7BRA4_ENGPU|nr:hypothetical protein GDO81_009476 [Engystomops pustulosus]